MRAARPIAEQPRREGGPARPHASPLPCDPRGFGPYGSRALSLQPSAPPPKASPQPAGVRSPALTTPGGEQRAREPRAAAGGASAALTAAPAARAAERRRRWGGTCWLSQPRASPGPPPGPPARRRQVPPRGAVSCQPPWLPPSPRVEPGPGRRRVRWGAGSGSLY